MELVDGGTLKDLIASGPAADAQAAGARHADRRRPRGRARGGHRAPRPEAGQRDGVQARLRQDPGLRPREAVTPEDQEVSALQTAAGDPTRPGLVMGTVGYMSPEQAAGRPVDFRSDQFSFGSILYEMATGKRAFERGTTAETLTAIIREEPDSVGAAEPEGAGADPLARRALPGQGPRGPLRHDQGPRARPRLVRDHLSEAVDHRRPRRAGDRRGGGARRTPAGPLAGARAAAALAAAVGVARVRRRTEEPAASRRRRSASSRSSAARSTRRDSRPTARRSSTPPRGRGGPSRSSSRGSTARRRGPFGLKSAGPAGRSPLRGNGDLAGPPIRRTLQADGHAGAHRDDGRRHAARGPGGRAVGGLVPGRPLVRGRARRRDRRCQLEYPVGKVLFHTTGWITNPRVSPDGRSVAFLHHPVHGRRRRVRRRRRSRPGKRPRARRRLLDRGRPRLVPGRPRGLVHGGGVRRQPRASTPCRSAAAGGSSCASPET